MKRDSKFEILQLSPSLPVRGLDAGMVVSRGDGIHLTRAMPLFDLLFVREGVLSVQEEEKAFEIHAGQSLLLWPNRLHWGTKIYPPNLRYFWLHFSTEDTPGGEETIAVPQFATVDRPDYVTELFLRYLDDQETGRREPLLSSLLLMLILHEIAYQRSLPEEENSAAVLAGRAHAYIRTNYRQPLTTSEIAASVGCNPQYLSRVYRRVYHMTVTDGIHQARLEYARRLLIDTNKSIKEIAFICGFTDPRYFYRLFRRREGMTALAFRRLNTRTFINVE